MHTPKQARVTVIGSLHRGEFERILRVAHRAPARLPLTGHHLCLPPRKKSSQHHLTHHREAVRRTRSPSTCIQRRTPASGTYPDAPAPVRTGRLARYEPSSRNAYSILCTLRRRPRADKAAISGDARLGFPNLAAKKHVLVRVHSRLNMSMGTGPHILVLVSYRTV